MRFSVYRIAKVVAISVAATFAPLAQARTAADFFVDAPAGVMPLLEHNARLDMLDYFRHQLQTPTANVMDGRSRILAEDPARIDVQISRDATVQLAVIPLKADTLIAVIETVLTPVADSGIRFYHTDWKPVKRQPLMPAMADFVPQEKRRETSAAEMPEVLYMKADYDPSTGLFTFVNTTAAYYTEFDRPEGLALMRSSVDMRFDGKKFVETPSSK